MEEKTFAERFARFKEDFALWPASDELRDEEGNHLGWAASVHIVRRDPAGDVVKGTITDPKAIPPNPRTYPTEDDANAHAFWIGLRWLEENE